MNMGLKRLELTRDEINILRDAVVDRLVEQGRRVQAQEEPTTRAYEILDTLQSLKYRLKDLAYHLP